MATISSPWVGISKGKLGEGVYYHSYGRQRARARNRQPANPRTAKQAVQRMVLSASSKVIAALRSLYNHSAEGVAVGNESIFYWQRELTRGFRAAASQAFNLGPSETPIWADFPIKGAPCIPFYDYMPLTKGRLSFRPILIVSDDVLQLSLTAELAEQFSTQDGYASELAKLGLEPGDQLTFVYLAIDTSQPVATIGNESNFAGIARYARVTFKATLPDGFDSALLNGGSFNAALIDKSEGTFPGLAVGTVSGGPALSFGPLMTGDLAVAAATLVRSQLQDNGMTYYNNALFRTDANNIDWNNAELVYPSYMDGVEGIDVGSTLYLKNAELALA